jgi:3-oxoacyl-[acyl-carrier-protein] synthase-3
MRVSPAISRVSPAISAIHYALPAVKRSVQELAANGDLESHPDLLESFGFGSVCIAETESPFDLALEAGQQLLTESGVDPESIGLLVWGGPPGASAFTTTPSVDLCGRALRSEARFAFPGARLQHELGLTQAAVIGVDQTACTTLFAAIRTAQAMCISEGFERALCVVSDFYPADAGREALFNCTSDAAVAVLVERTGSRNRIIVFRQITKGYYWDPTTHRNEVIASYFPTARHVIADTIQAAGWLPSAVDWVIPHNVSLRSWDVLGGLLDLPKARFWTDNIKRLGHTLAGDNFINLADAIAGGDVQPGHKLLLFSYGYGAHWTALALEA